MTTYNPPKLDGQKMPLKVRVRSQVHKAAWERAHSLNLSISEYVGALIARDNGLPSVLDDIEQGRLTFEDETRRTA